ncbi:hypothetical protein HJB81_25680 [Rhizobium sp. NZLR1]|nr:hypothetical protein [Rhizobium sp. NZLR1]QSZ23372.1 hypothetical protein J3O30_24950 [Rhizobium sp. NZLR1]
MAVSLLADNGLEITRKKRKEPLHLPDEAEIDAACLDMADAVIGGTAFDMLADIGIFAGNA